MRKFRGPLEMFSLWVLDRGLVHMPSKPMKEPRLGDAVIAVLALDSMLVKHTDNCRHSFKGRSNSIATDSVDHCQSSQTHGKSERKLSFFPKAHTETSPNQRTYAPKGENESSTKKNSPKK